jgi:hypothetical protein
MGVSNLESREQEQNKYNLGAELDSLRRHKQRVENKELLMLFSIVESLAEKVDRHFKREGGL